MKDVFIKQGSDTTDGEDDNIYVIFQSRKAQELSGQQKIKLEKEWEVSKILSWAISHNLTTHSEIPIIV